MAAIELLEIFCCAALRAALQLCCVPEDRIEVANAKWRQHRNPRLVCYLDGLSDEVVKRQLEFRKERWIQRENSNASLTSLAIVSEDDVLSVRQVPPEIIRKTMSTPALMETPGCASCPHGRHPSSSSPGHMLRSSRHNAASRKRAS